MCVFFSRGYNQLSPCFFSSCVCLFLSFSFGSMAGQVAVLGWFHSPVTGVCFPVDAVLSRRLALFFFFFFNQLDLSTFGWWFLWCLVSRSGSSLGSPRAHGVLHTALHGELPRNFSHERHR